MKFEFTTTTTVDTTAWNKSNKKLEQDLQEIATKTVSEKDVITYLNDMVRALRPVKNDKCKRISGSENLKRIQITNIFIISCATELTPQ